MYNIFNQRFPSPDCATCPGIGVRHHRNPHMKTFTENNEWDLLNNYSDLKKVNPIMLNDHNAIWIESNHPCRHDDAYQKEDTINFSRYRELISELWKRSPKNN